jgi:hypothetical protein
MKKPKHVWVVEVRFEHRESYKPTVGVGLTKSDAAIVMEQWRQRNSDDQFRLRKYVCHE